MKQHEPSWTIMKNHETSWNIMKHHETSWDIMKHHETSWNIMKHYETSSNIMKHHETSWNIRKHDIIKHHSLNIMKHDIMKHHQTSWNMISWNIMKHHKTSWNIVKHHDTSWHIMKRMFSPEVPSSDGLQVHWSGLVLWRLHQLHRQVCRLRGRRLCRLRGDQGELVIFIPVQNMRCSRIFMDFHGFWCDEFLFKIESNAWELWVAPRHLGTRGISWHPGGWSSCVYRKQNIEKQTSTRDSPSE